jgi:meiosis induction protein kinase IME2/SME1
VAPAVQRAPSVQRTPSVTPSHSTPLESNGPKPRPNANKRATWAHGPPNAAPMPLLPSIRPVSPLYNAVTAQAVQRTNEPPKKSGSQIPVAQDPKPELQKSSSGTSGLRSPPSSQRESFFSHLRKRARRFSGRYQTPISPNDDIESNAGSTQWNSRQSPMLNSLPQIPKDMSTDFSDLDKALQSVRTSVDSPHNSTIKVVSHPYGGNSMLKRHHSSGSREPSQHGLRQRPPGRQQSQSNLQYETPDEEDELLDEALNVARNAAQKLHVPLNYRPSPHSPPSSALRSDPAPLVQKQHAPLHYRPSPSDPALAPNMAVQHPRQQQPMPPQQFHSTNLTPAPSANRSSVLHGHTDYMFHTKPLDILKPRHAQEPVPPKWPTPPYDESDWGSAVQASLFSSQPVYR